MTLGGGAQGSSGELESSERAKKATRHGDVDPKLRPLVHSRAEPGEPPASAEPRIVVLDFDPYADELVLRLLRVGALPSNADS